MATMKVARKRHGVLTGPFVLLSDFDGKLPVMNPAETDFSKKHLFNQYTRDPTDGPDPGFAKVAKRAAYSGTLGLEARIKKGSAYIQFYPCVNGKWSYMKEHVQAGRWQDKTFNRISFFVKPPRDVEVPLPGRPMAHFGTYLRDYGDDPYDAEGTKNGHYYHYLQLLGGAWNRVLIDPKPHTFRNHGSQDYPEIRWPWDRLTRWYLDFEGGCGKYPATFMMDSVALYQAPKREKTQYIYGMTAAYRKQDKLFQVAWSRSRKKPTMKFEVRWLDRSLYKAGWGNAKPVPNGKGCVSPRDDDYNCMSWSGKIPDAAGKKTVYLGVNYGQNFREILVPMG